MAWPEARVLVRPCSCGDLYNFLAACPPATIVFVPTAQAPSPPDGGWVAGGCGAPTGLLEGGDWVAFLLGLEQRGALDAPVCLYTGHAEVSLEAFREPLSAPEVFEQVLSLTTVNVLAAAAFREFLEAYGGWLCGAVGAPGFPPAQAAPSHLREVHPRLFLGDKDAAASAVALEALGITHALNCTSDLADAALPEEACLRVPLAGEPEEDLLWYLEDGLSFVADALGAGKGGCLVHCRVGVSRAATVCVAFAMRLHGCSIADALAKVREDRWCVRPNPCFVAQLQRWSADPGAAPA